ncbi:MAG: hypothetical protein K2K16_05680 [Ruminococcus sp.]|nr:hypothetical protein [Ruminococcus sp.]
MNKKKEKIKLLLDVVAVFVALIVGMFIIDFLIEGFSVFDTNYHFFGKKRIAEMEELFGIEVTDDIHLKEYRESSWLSFDYVLDINQINSYTDFLQNNVKSTDISEPSFDDRLKEAVSYNYTWQNDTVYIYFLRQRDSTYIAELSIVR